MAFLRKDLMEVLRQPRLVLMLIVGPFLILLAFGLGYDASRPPLEAILVIDEESPQNRQELEEALGAGISLAQVTADESSARRRLADGQVDLVIVVPPDAADQVRANERATIEIYHAQIDPFEREFVNLAAASAVEELNRSILRQAVVEGQRESADLEEQLPRARAAVDSMLAASEQGRDPSPADQLTLQQSLIGLTTLAGYRAGVLAGIGPEAEDAAGWEAIGRIDGNSSTVRDPSTPADERRAALEQLSSDLEIVESDLATFRDVDADVLVSPFRSEASNVSGVSVGFSDFYVPGVVALLLQHLAITFAGLSLVRERVLGSVELFRVAPVSAGETLAGKYLAYLLLAALVAAALVAAAVFGFGFTVAGNWAWFAVIAVLVIMASLGLGFVISALVRSESEAIQYAMMLLLISIFFSGFFLPIDRLIAPVQVVSWLLPATYGIEALQQVAFEGRAPDMSLVAGAAAYAVVTLAAALLLTRRQGITTHVRAAEAQPAT